MILIVFFKEIFAMTHSHTVQRNQFS